MHTIARDPESGAFVVVLNGCQHLLSALEFDAFAHQVLRALQILVPDPNFRQGLSESKLVCVGCLPELKQFTLAFQSLYPQGIYRCKGHHSIPDGDHDPIALWNILGEHYREMLTALSDGQDARATDARETVTMIMQSVGLKWP
jgi:hypothetical protein